MSAFRKLGEILREEFELSAEALHAALEHQESSAHHKRLGQILLAQAAIGQQALSQALARQQGLEFLPSLGTLESDPELLKLIPMGFSRSYGILPLSQGEQRVRIAVSDPLDLRPVQDVSALCGAYVERVLATPEEILKATHRAYEKHAGDADEMVETMGTADEEGLAEGLEPEDLLDTSDEAPIIRFVNSLVTQALKERASDIHIEPFDDRLVVRFRIDGILYEVVRPPLKAHASICSRIKIMAGLNIAEKRLPQDGRFRVRIGGKDLDVRVSTLPVAFGERVVLRLLDRSSSVLSLEDLGIQSRLLTSVCQMIRKSHGIFLVTGPTGSGKTTTLYAALSRLNSAEKNIITVEDPIEYQLAGVGQIQVNAKINLTFAAGLRSILRQDPDIIMVGEIRDRETAEIAIQSALTGHMVFSTLHTNDSAGALTRLVEMGIEPFLAASSIVGILAQRLVRRVCSHCREEQPIEDGLLREMGFSDLAGHGAVFYRGRGCNHCMETGYSGRTGIYELLVVDDEVRQLLLANKDSATIKAAALMRGMELLRDSGIAKALAGETTLEEVMRVTQEDS